MREIREDLGLRQADVGQEMGLSVASVSDLERGRTRITLDRLEAWQVALAAASGESDEDIARRFLDAAERAAVLIPYVVSGVVASSPGMVTFTASDATGTVAQTWTVVP
jgi:transcriptional regulator with XRE-family HTH domain